MANREGGGKMRKILILMLSVVMLGMMAGSSFAEGATAPQYPMYMTTSGQGPDGMMLDILLNKSMGIPVKFDTVLKAENCGDMKTLIFVVGYSGKGMTAASINDAAEEARVKALLELATKNDAYIIIVHMSGTSRRGGSSDKFTALAAATANKLIVIPDSNKDGYFNKMATEKGIPLILVDIPEGGSVRTLVAQALKAELPAPVK